MIYVMHHSDTDGYGACYAAWRKFGSDAKYFPVNYGDRFPVEILDLHPNDAVYVLDFCFPDHIMQQVAKRCGLLVIDHHKTHHQNSGHHKWFKYDAEESGCTLAWQHFHLRAKTPQILNHVRDWDLWRFELPYTKEYHTYIDVYKKDMEVWDAIATTGLTEDVFVRAQTMHAHRKYCVAQQAKRCWKKTFQGFPASIVCVQYPFTSDTLAKMLHDNPESAIAVGVSFKSTGPTVSLRSRENGPDVSEIAARFPNGGGHRGAARFSCGYSTVKFLLPGNE